MTANIKNIFKTNISLIGNMDRAVLLFRYLQCDKALSLVADSIDQIKVSLDAIINDREYFNLVSTDSIYEMLSSILEAQNNRDYILLADLLELQLVSFLCGVQELIISREEIEFDENLYQENIRLLLNLGTGIDALQDEPVNSASLLEKGYRVEFTSCGLMTIAAENNGQAFYLHTNNRICSEAFLLASHWLKEGKNNYILYGFGMGYYVDELSRLAPDAIITVYEADLNIIKLAAAFNDLAFLNGRHNIHVVYDPEFTNIEKHINKHDKNTEIIVHYPSYKNIRNEKGNIILEKYVPWSKTLESC